MGTLRIHRADGATSSPSALETLAAALTEARQADTACERFAEQVRIWLPDAAVRVFLLGPGDRCPTCLRARECATRDRCLHLAAGTGTFAQPAGHVERVPRSLTPWVDALGNAAAAGSDGPVPAELVGPGEDADGATVRYLPIRAQGQTLGVAVVRLPEDPPEAGMRLLSQAAFLVGAAVGAAASRAEERRRFEQILLVNELGRKVNSILNLELLMHQAVVDVQRTFGYRHVSLFMLDPTRRRMTLKAQSTAYAPHELPHDGITIEQGLVGRAARSGRTVRVDDVSAENEYVPWYAETRSELAVPVRIGGVVEAVLNVESDAVAAFGEADVVVLETAANQLAIAIENARLFGRVKESEEEYRTLVESSPIAVFQVDPTGRLTYVNPAASDITGLDRATLLARLHAAEDLAVEEDRERLAAALAAARTGVSKHGLEMRAMHADGRARWIAAEVQPLIAEGGTRKGLLVLARNITREKELQMQLAQSEKLKAMGEMVSGVAHELNNPLAGILGYAQLFLSRPTEQWPRRDMEKIEGNARRCKKIVENLLTFARQSRSERLPASMNQVIESVISLNEYQFRMDNVEMVRDFDPAIPEIPMDVSRWQQVFINLAGNAREALVESGTEVRRITFSTRKRGEEVVVRVEDSGPGIPRHLLGRIFEPFFTTREKGTGLGLGLCYGIVTDHGGTIVADAEPGRGATFTIRLPIHLAPETPIVPNAPLRDKPAVAGPKPRALVVDDEPVVRDVVTHVLELHGYEVETADDSAEALVAVEGRDFDVVLSDIRMPGPLDGRGFHERLRETRPDLARRVVFMTGDILEHSAFREIEDMGLHYVRKPFDIRELARVVNAVARAPRGGAPTT